jgi:hypothetical protein
MAREDSRWMSPLRRPDPRPLVVEIDRRETIDPTRASELVALLAKLIAARRVKQLKRRRTPEQRR